MSEKCCAVPDCLRRAQCSVDNQRVCLMHYKRWKRHGDVNFIGRKWGAPNRNRVACILAECGEMQDGNSPYCKKHDTRARRHGDPHIAIPQAARNLPRGEDHRQWTGDEATYSAVHQRIRKAFGSASQYKCIDCGHDAAHWSYNHSGKDEKHSNLGLYSTDLNQYVARCVPCHKKFDLSVLGMRHG